MANYEHDIFVSYRRMDKDWIKWTRENFTRPLRSLLRPGLGSVKIFVDDQIETGASWPAYLARALARSRLLIPVLSRDYFNSDWCRLELALMHHRETLVSFRTPAMSDVLILPVVIDDGDCFPPEVQAMQGEPIHEYALPFMSIDGQRQEDFAAHLKQWCLTKRSRRDAEQLARQAVNILVKFTIVTGHEHANLQTTVENYVTILKQMGRTDEEIKATLDSLDMELSLSNKVFEKRTNMNNCSEEEPGKNTGAT